MRHITDSYTAEEVIRSIEIYRGGGEIGLAWGGYGAVGIEAAEAFRDALNEAIQKAREELEA